MAKTSLPKFHYYLSVQLSFVRKEILSSRTEKSEGKHLILKRLVFYLFKSIDDF